MITFHLSWELCQDVFLYSEASHLCVWGETKSAPKTLILEFNGHYRRNTCLLHKFHSMGSMTVCTCHLLIQTNFWVSTILFYSIPLSHILMISSSTQIWSKTCLCSWLCLSVELTGLTEKNYKTVERKPLSEQIANSKDSSGVVHCFARQKRLLSTRPKHYFCLFGTRAGWGYIFKSN